MFGPASLHNSIIGTLPPTPASPQAPAGATLSVRELRALVASRRGVSVLSDAELSALLATSREALVTVAREDINVFAALVLRDERTGKRVEQAPVHRAMHGFLDARTPTGELKHPRAVVWGHVEAGKTQSVVIARVLFMLGHDPTLRIVIASKVATRAAYIVTSIAAYIENSDDLHAVFPALRKGPLWRLDALRIQGAGYATDPSVRAMGVGTTTLGSRVDVFIGDDIIDMESTRTPYLRQQTVDWFFGVIEGRLTADALVYIIGNAWHPADAMHRLAATDGWASRRFPVLDERTGALSWPARWPRSRIDKKRRGMPPTEFARAYLCKARADEDARFARRDIERAMERGRGLVIGPDRAHWRPGIADHVRRACRFYTGVDLAVSQRKKADRTALVTLAVWPDGTREVVDIQTGRWNAAEILRRIVRVTQAWGSIACIENVAAQDWMRQFAEIARVKTVAYSTGTSQPPLDFQAEQLAAEFAQGRWVIPMGAGGELDAEVSAWVNALLYYVPARHTPDVMAASLFAMHAAGSADSMDATGVEDAVRAVLTAAVGSAEGAPRRDVWG